MLLFVNENKGILFLSGVSTTPVVPPEAERDGGPAKRSLFRPYEPEDKLQLQRVREDEEIILIINTFIRSFKKWHH